MKNSLIIIFCLFFSLSHYGQIDTRKTNNKNEMKFLFIKGAKKVNHCTPWHHLQCVAITGTEVFEDGRDRKKGRHWWRMSYIGRACTDKYGKVLGTIFEGFWAIPHYTGVVIGSGFGWMIYAIRGPRNPDKIAKRQQKRNLKKKKQEKNKATV